MRVWLSAVGSESILYLKDGKVPFRRYLDGERFDPETTRLLGVAFAFTVQALHNWGADDPPRESIATAIISYAKAGERDPERLCDLAVEACSKLLTTAPNPLQPPRGAATAPRDRGRGPDHGNRSSRRTQGI